VAGIFLDRPFVVPALGEDFGRKAGDSGCEAVGRGPETSEDFRDGLGRETELEGSGEPFACLCVRHANKLNEELGIKN